MPSPNRPANPLLGDQKPTIAVLPPSEGHQQDGDPAALKLAPHSASPVARRPMSDPSALNATRLSDRQSLPFQGSSQRAAFDALNLALEEGNVFAALTGPAGTGKTTVLNAVLANPIGCKLRIIRLVDPHLVSAKSAAHIEQVASTEAIKTENAGRHVVLTVDDAHAASDELMRCLTRLAAAKRAGARFPQLFIVGRPEFWDRLKAPEYEPLARRIAVRSVLEQALNKPLSVPMEQEFTREAPSLHTAPSPDLDESRSIQAEAPPANTGVDFAAIISRGSVDAEPMSSPVMTGTSDLTGYTQPKAWRLLPFVIVPGILAVALYALAWFGWPPQRMAEVARAADKRDSVPASVEPAQIDSPLARAQVVPSRTPAVSIGSVQGLPMLDLPAQPVTSAIGNSEIRDIGRGMTASSAIAGSGRIGFNSTPLLGTGPRRVSEEQPPTPASPFAAPPQSIGLAKDTETGTTAATSPNFSQPISVLRVQEQPMTSSIGSPQSGDRSRGGTASLAVAPSRQMGVGPPLPPGTGPQGTAGEVAPTASPVAAPPPKVGLASGASRGSTLSVSADFSQSLSASSVQAHPVTLLIGNPESGDTGQSVTVSLTPPGLRMGSDPLVPPGAGAQEARAELRTPAPPVAVPPRPTGSANTREVTLPPGAEPRATTSTQFPSPQGAVAETRLGDSAASPASPISPELVKLLLRRGDEQLALGDVSAARLLYRRAAAAGNAQAARLAARTYDKAFLPAAAIEPLADRETALAWYRRAAALGDTEGAERLHELDAGR